MKTGAASVVGRIMAGAAVLLVSLAAVALLWQRGGERLPADRDAPLQEQEDASMPALPSSTPHQQPTAAQVPDREALLFDGEAAMRHVEAQVALGPRPTGSEASQETAEYILNTLEGLGWQTDSWRFIYQGVGGRNLVGRAGAEGGPILMFGAHYDTRLRADHDPIAPEEPVLGANDGASGVAVLLELARVVDLDAVQGEVWLVFFDAEDNGNLDGWEYAAGARIFVQQVPVVPEYLVLVDMVGDADQDMYYEGNSDPQLRAHLWDIAAELGYEAHFIPQVRHWLTDDHIPFVERGIPAVDIIDFDYPYWHTTQDTLDKVSPVSLERVGRALQVFLERGGLYPEVEQ